MADISQVKLPDGTTYNLKDSYVRTNYRALNNNDFDTINVTELNGGDVVVTGVGRFTNGLYGNLTGNADTATNVAWSGVTGKPSTYPPSPHTHAEIYTVGDYRSSATTPNDYKNMLRFQGLKSKATIDSPSSDTYSYLLGLRGWADNSGGDAWELAFNNSGINVRHGATTTWGSWTKLLDSSNYNDYAPTKTGTGASGTWGISITGNATTATSATSASKLGSSNVGSATQPIYLNAGSPAACTYTLGKSVPSDAVFTDTKNTAGSTDTSSKIYLIGATSQAANPQTYSQDTAYVGTDGCLYSGGSKVLTAHQDISGKVSKIGDTMSGALTVEASNSYSSYNEGIRINAGARTYATLLMGGTAGTTSGTNDGAFWIGVYNTGTTARRLMIAHNGSTNTGTYFYASSSSDISPSLRVGSNLQVANVISANVSNSGTAGGISLYSTDPTSYGVAMRSTSNSGKHGYVQGDWGTYFYMAGATNRGWVFVNAGSGNRASISTEGNMVLNGSLTLGGNATNTSGVRQVYNSTTKSLDFVFVA